MNDSLTKKEEKEMLKQSEEHGKMNHYFLKMGVNYLLAEAICWKKDGCICEEAQPLDLSEIEVAVGAIAKLKHDGHYTALKFTSGYKVFFGTPDLRSGSDSEKIWEMETFNDLKTEMVFSIEMENCLR